MPEKVCRSEGALYQWADLDAVNRTLGLLRGRGIVKGMPGFQEVYILRGKIMGSLGLLAPKPTALVKTLVGLSPGQINLHYDPECGWLSEARAKPGASPVYHYVDDDTAVAIIKGELTPELEQQLMAPDDYIGE